MNKPLLLAIEHAASKPEVASFPLYRRQEIACKIGHLGLGNFHRSHLARYVDELNSLHDDECLIHGIGMMLQDGQLIENLRDQGGLYTLTERSATKDTIRVIGSIGEVSHGPSDTITS